MYAGPLNMDCGCITRQSLARQQGDTLFRTTGTSQYPAAMDEALAIAILNFVSARPSSTSEAGVGVKDDQVPGEESLGSTFTDPGVALPDDPAPGEESSESTFPDPGVVLPVEDKEFSVGLTGVALSFRAAEAEMPGCWKWNSPSDRCRFNCGRLYVCQHCFDKPPAHSCPKLRRDTSGGETAAETTS